MNLSLSAATSILSNDKQSIPTLSKRDIFYSTYQHNQIWTLPDTVIYYISKNSSSSKVYEKLIQLCKYFFIKNPILIVTRLFFRYEKNEWKILFNEKEVVDLNNINCKIWTTDYFCSNVFDKNAKKVKDQYLGTSLLSKIFQCDARDILIANQNITINNLIFLASKCEEIRLWNVTVFNENGSGVVAVEKIVEIFPIVKYFFFNLGDTSPNIISSKTAKNLLKIPNFEHLELFKLGDIPDSFDIETIFSYIKKNKKTEFYLRFAENISQQYRNRLQAIVNEIIENENRVYQPPYIQFLGIDASSHQKIFNLFFHGFKYRKIGRT